MRCADCRFARVTCKVFDHGRIQKSKIGVTVRCVKGQWTEFMGKEKIYKTLFPILKEEGKIKDFQQNCMEYEESQVPVGTWQD